jgi:hypothetical protein
MLPRFYRKYVPRDTMYPTAPTMVFWYVMLIVRDLIRALRFPLQEDSGWISLARASQLDYGAVAEVSLYLAGVPARSHTPLFTRVRGRGILGSP